MEKWSVLLLYYQAQTTVLWAGVQLNFKMMNNQHSILQSVQKMNCRLTDSPLLTVGQKDPSPCYSQESIQIIFPLLSGGVWGPQSLWSHLVFAVLHSEYHHTTMVPILFLSYVEYIPLCSLPSKLCKTQVK